MTATAAIPVRLSSGPLTRGQARAVARTMHVEGDWGYTEIQRYLRGRGVTAAWSTVKRWADPAFDESERQRTRARERRRWMGLTDGSIGRVDHTPEFKLTRVRALSNAGLSSGAIAKLMRFDYGDRLSKHQVEYALEVGRYPARPSRKAIT